MSEAQAGPPDAAAPELKDRVRAHWERETCGTRYGSSASRREYFDEIERARYALEPYIPDFARFDEAEGLRVLEVGVGAGSDFCGWVEAGARATGIDLTDAAIENTRDHLEARGLADRPHELRRVDAEALPFEDGCFDLVYSWGVLHHSPDTARAFAEVCRVLKPGGTFRGMVYHVPSWSGWMIWLLHGPLRGRPLRSVKDAIFEHLESPGTKAYTLGEADALLRGAGFEPPRLATRLNPGDLLDIRPSEKYRHPLYRWVWRLYPRWLVRALGDRFGLNLLIEAHKPAR